LTVYEGEGYLVNENVGKPGDFKSQLISFVFNSPTQTTL